MHPYATDSAERKWVIVYLAVLSIYRPDHGAVTGLEPVVLGLFGCRVVCASLLPR